MCGKDLGDMLLCFVYCVLGLSKHRSFLLKPTPSRHVFHGGRKKKTLPNYFQDNMRRLYQSLTESTCLALGFSSTGPWQFHFHSCFFSPKYPLFPTHHKMILWILSLHRSLFVEILFTILFSVRNWWGIGNVPRTSCWQDLFHFPLFQLCLLPHSDPTP